MSMLKRSAFTYALPLTTPICAGFLFLGLSYGLYATSKGLPVYYPTLMSALIYAGSMEFVTVSLLLAPFNPVGVFFLTLMVNARHIFYGLAMLAKYRHLGWKTYYLIFGMCDETFAINAATDVPPDIDRSWFYVHVTWLNQAYWVGGATIGGLVGNYLTFLPTKGIEFILTALFLVLLLELTHKEKGLRNGLIGLATTAAALLIFGAAQFIIPAMIGITSIFFVLYKKGDVLRD